MSTPTSKTKLSAWELQAQLWKRELIPSSPFMFHREYRESDGDDPASASDIAAALSGYVSPTRIHSHSVQQAQVESQMSAALQGRMVEHKRTPLSETGGKKRSNSRGTSPASAANHRTAESLSGSVVTPSAAGRGGGASISGIAGIAGTAAASPSPAGYNDDPKNSNNNNNDENNVEYDDAIVRLGNQRAMFVEAGAVIDEMSPDRGSFRAFRRRADVLRSDAETKKLVVAAAASASSPSPAATGSRVEAAAAAAVSGGVTPNSKPPRIGPQQQPQHPHRHGLESVACPYRLHSIVSQKEALKRRRVDLHATSASMLGRGRTTHNMSDADVAGYTPNARTSMKLDRSPELVLSDTVAAARGGLTPEERLNKQVNRFIEKLVNAAEREEENQIIPKGRKQWPSEREAAAAAVAHSVSLGGDDTKFTPDRLLNGSGFLVGAKAPPSAVRRPGFAQRLLQEQEGHIVDAMAHMIMAGASPQHAVDASAIAHEPQRVTVHNAVSFPLSADDKHVLLTALQFALSEEFFPGSGGNMDFLRVTGFSQSAARRVLKQLGATFDHWNKVCYDVGGEWPLLKRCLAAVTETPINWSIRPHTARSAHFGTVSQRDLEGLLDRLRNDEVKKVKVPVSERHKGRSF